LSSRPPQAWLATFFGAGMSPVAPGTAGSLAASLVLCLIYRCNDSWTYAAWQSVLVAGLIIASAAAVALGPWAFTFYGRKDPGSFVLDEVAGICLTTLFQPMYPGWHQAYALLAAFLAFRLFDVWKPWPCPSLEKLPAGWGILADDLGAAIYANVVGQLILRLLL
jgi:phosphatidylglycerophosphatase A